MNLFTFHLRGETRPCAAEGCDREFIGHPNKMYCSRYCSRYRRTCMDCGCQITESSQRCNSCSKIYMWQGEEFRKKHSQTVKNPEYRQRHSKILTLIYQNPDIRKAAGARSRARWENPEYRTTTIENMCKANQLPERLKRRSENTRKMWKNPEHRHKVGKAISDALSGGNTTLLCVECGKAFDRAVRLHNSLTKGGTPPYCSKKCSSKARGRKTREHHFKGYITFSCEQCGNEHTETRSRYNARLNAGSRLFCTAQCYYDSLKVRRSVRGYKNPDVWRRIKPLIYLRDNGECQNCYALEKARRFPVHHIDDGKDNHFPHNLITLCDECHCHYTHIVNDEVKDTRRIEWGKIAKERSQAMPLGWWEQVNEALEFAGNGMKK